MSRLEDDLRATLQRHATDGEPLGGMPADVSRRAQRRRAGTAGVTGVVGLALVAVTVAVARSVQPSPPPQPAPPPPLPPIERVQHDPHHNGDLVFPVDGALVRRAPDGHTSTWVTRSTMNQACGSRSCSIANLSWSPDGTELAVVMGVVRRTSPSKYSVYLVADRSTTPRLVFDCPSSLCSGGASVSWSPDGTSVAVSDTYAAGVGIVIVGVTGPETQPRTVCSCQSGSVRWSPNGRWLAYTSPEGIRRISVSGKASEQVDSSTNVSSVTWSPDGTRLLVETSTAVRTIDLSRRPYAETTIVEGISPSEGPSVPAWSPDGARVSWFSTPGKHPDFVAEVWTAARDGSDPTRVLDGGCCVSDWSAPLWSPDGKLLALGLSLDPARPPDLLVLDAAQGTLLDRATGMGWGPMAWQPRA